MKLSIDRIKVLIGFIFFFSGFASLIYQIVWQRLMTLHYGVGSISITLIVSVYMLGLGIGSIAGGFLAERFKNKILIYFVIELLIGLFGLISLPFLKYLGEKTAGSSYYLSFIFMFIFLFFPTFLMGTTLPLLTKIYNNIVRIFLNTVSFLYFINTIGAAFGALLASYLIISFFGLDTAIYFAVTINFILAILIFAIKSPLQYTDENIINNFQEKNLNFILDKFIYLIVICTGFLAIGYELIWFRVLGVLVKASPYAFSSILSIYLLGIALGSFYMYKFLTKYDIKSKQNLFFLIQFLIGISVSSITLLYYYLTKYTHFNLFSLVSFVNPLHPSLMLSLDSIKDLFIGIYNNVDIFIWPAVFILIPTILMGASFPLISSLALKNENKEGKTVAIVYFFTIAGNVLGGIITGFVLLPFFGTEITLIIFSSIGIIFLVFLTNFLDFKPLIFQRGLVTAVILLLNFTLMPKAGDLYAVMYPSFKFYDKAFFEEGIDGVNKIYMNDTNLLMYIDGLAHGGRPGYMFIHETIEAMSYSPGIKNVLIIGFGTGTITETVLKSDSVENVHLVEINRTLIKNLSKIPVINSILNDKRLTTIIDDGRRFLLRTDKKYDLILIDPLRTTTAYSNNLYSSQFFNLIKKHLKNDGIFFLYMDEHKIMPKTVASVFDHIRYYNGFALASEKKFQLNKKTKTDLLNLYSIEERRIISEFEHKKLSNYVGNEEYIRKNTKNVPINQDWKPWCEYYLRRKFFSQ